MIIWLIRIACATMTMQLMKDYSDSFYTGYITCFVTVILLIMTAPTKRTEVENEVSDQ